MRTRAWRALPALVGGTALLLAGVIPAGAQSQGTVEDPGGFLNIAPPGQKGVFSGPEALAAQGGQLPPNTADQLAMYAALVGAVPGLAGDDLHDLFKPAPLGVPDDVAREYHPGGRDDVVVYRDATFGVPHIVGDTRAGTMFAQGYTGAEDRLFLMDVLRHVGRAELTAFLGPSPGNVALDRDQLAAAPYREEDLTAQSAAIAASGPIGAAVIADGEAYLAGVNHYIAEALAGQATLPAEYVALQKVPDEFVPEDIVAIASLVGAQFGRGGGREVRNLCALEELAGAGALGDAASARAVFDDFKLRDDAEAPTTTTREFVYLSDLGPVDPAAIPDLDCGSIQPIEAPPPGIEEFTGAVVDLVPSPPLPGPEGSDASEARVGTIELPWGPQPLAFANALSNALLIGGQHTDTGSPIAVFGPQTGYYMPQLLVEKSVVGPGIAARGVSFAGTDIYVQLGRGVDYAYSATSAGGDNVDQFVLQLCEPDGGDATIASMGYLHDGACKEIEAHQDVRIAQVTGGGLPEAPGDLEEILVNKYFERAPDYGPVTARATLVDGTPVAIAVRRSTYGDELGSARGFHQVNDPGFMAGGFDAFREAFGEGVDYTFNWFYVDQTDIGLQVSCLCPQRAQGVDPYLPAWGTGEWDWQGFLPLAAKPWDRNPASGYLVSWNNKQAPGFWSNDAQFGWGPIHRSDLLERRLGDRMAGGALDLAAAVEVMGLAATTDLRAQELVDLLVAVMGDTAPSGADPRAQAMLDLVRAWASDDHGHRRDHDGDGSYEHATAIAIMDAWWSPLFDAMFLAESADARRVIGFSLHDTNLENHIGSAFQDSAYAHVHKDLRQVLGQAVADPFHRTYCGGGDLAVCRAALWDSLADAAAALEDEFDSDEVAGWQRVPADDEIRHVAVGVVAVPPIHWQNRPTFQQAVQLPAPEAVPPPPPPPLPIPPPVPLPTTGIQPALLVGGLVLLLAAALLRRRRWFT